MLTGERRRGLEALDRTLRRHHLLAAARRGWDASRPDADHPEQVVVSTVATAAVGVALSCLS